MSLKKLGRKSRTCRKGSIQITRISDQSAVGRFPRPLFISGNGPEKLPETVSIAFYSGTFGHSRRKSNWECTRQQFLCHRPETVPVPVATPRRKDRAELPGSRDRGFVRKQQSDRQDCAGNPREIFAVNASPPGRG